MEEHGRITLEQHEDGIAILSMHDEPGRNALSAPFVEELTIKLNELSQSTDCRVCVVRGLPGVFCSGGDKQMLLELAQGKVATTDIMVSRAMLEVPIPTIAAMEGHAVGGGLTLGLCCDIVLMARESRYGSSFMNMGFTPGMGTTKLLAEAVGEFVAAEMMYGGQFFRGSDFVGRSGINYVLPRDKITHKAMQIAQRITEKPRPILELLKRTLSLRKRQAFEDARTSESIMHEICFSRVETRSMIEEFYEEPLSTPSFIKASLKL